MSDPFYRTVSEIYESYKLDDENGQEIGQTAMDFIILVEERDAIKAENEDLRDIKESYKSLLEVEAKVLDEKKAEINRLRELLGKARNKISSLFDLIKHGDEEHQRWLKTELDKHFADTQAEIDAAGLLKEKK